MSHEKKPRRRNAGRPQAVHGVGKERIVQAARELLRDRAPEELTVVEIAAAAEVDPALVRYYFGTKKGIFRATAQDLLAQVQARSAQVLADDGPLRERIRKRLELLVGFHEENPRFLELVLKEIYGANEAEDDRHRSDLAEVAARGLFLTESLLGAVPPGAALGPDARFLHVAILGLSTFFVDARPLLAVLFGPDADPARIRAGYIDALTELLARGLESGAPDLDEGHGPHRV